MPGHRLSPTQAGAIAKRARKLLRRGLITHRQLALLDCLLWSCRRPDTGAIVVSYTALQRLAHVARATVAAGLRRLEELGLLSRVKRRVRVLWANGGQQSRQAASAYVLHAPDPHSEFSARTVIGIQETLIRERHDNAAVRDAQEALARRREAFTRGLLTRR
ncbi:MAG: hypothetical protein JOY66_14380 [Acetobacteraceae bacterium]|nr:hypothetical protein [Acetobacteraceae bacterium]